MLALSLVNLAFTSSVLQGGVIDPFGDGNGRVGRALVMAQCLNARLMPPVFDGNNRAMYYAAMQHAMKHGRYSPLIRLFYQSVA